MSDRDVNININGKDNASRIIGGVGKSTDTLSTQLGRLKMAFGALIGARVVGRVVGSLMETAEMMDEVGKSSDKIGIATEELLGLKWAADQSGVSFESLDKSLVKMSRNLSDVGRGGGKMVSDSLADIGLSAKELLKLTAGEQFDRIADGLNALPSDADRIRVAMDIFGKAGADLIPLLAEGSEGLKAFREEAEKMGIIFSREDAARMEEFNDQINKMNTSLGALKVTLLGMAAPTVTTGAKIVTDMLNGTDSVESRAFWAVSWHANPFTDPRDDPSLKNDLTAPAISQEQIDRELAALGVKRAEATAQQRTRSEAAVGKFTDFLMGNDKPKGSDDPMDDAKKARDEVLNIFQGVKSGVGSLVGSVANTGQEIGTSLVKGIEVGWDASKERLASRIKSLTDEVKTPAELLREGMAEIAELSQRGLDPETAARQRKLLQERFNESLPALSAATIPQLAAREFRALTSAPGASNPALQAVQEAKRQTKIAETQTKLLEEANLLLRDIKDQQPAAADFD